MERIDGTPRCLLAIPRGGLQERSVAALSFGVFASARRRATFPLDRSFSGSEQLRSDNDLRIYRPGFDRPNTHRRFTHLALQSWMGIWASPGHWHCLPDAAGYDVDRPRAWDRGFLAGH